MTDIWQRSPAARPESRQGCDRALDRSDRRPRRL